MRLSCGWGGCDNNCQGTESETRQNSNFTGKLNKINPGHINVFGHKKRYLPHLSAVVNIVSSSGVLSGFDRLKKVYMGRKDVRRYSTLTWGDKGTKLGVIFNKTLQLSNQEPLSMAWTMSNVWRVYFDGLMTN